MLLVKHGALLQNERLKLYKKPSTWILMAVIVALTLISLLLTNAVTAMYSSNMMGNYTWQQAYNDQIKSYSSQAEGTEGKDNAAYYKSQVDSLRYLLQNKIPPDDWRTDVVMEYYSLQYGSGYTTEDGKMVTPDVSDAAAVKERMDKLKAILDQNDWRDYVKMKISDLESGYTPSASTQEKEVDIEVYNLYLNMGIAPISTSMSSYTSGVLAKSSDSWKATELETIRSNKLYLVRGENKSGTLLTNTQRSTYQQEIDVALERLKTNTAPVESSTFLGILEGSASSLDLLSILLIVLAGGILASEYSRGTVKLLLITPHRRFKIFWAKAGILLEVTLIATGAIFVLSFLLAGAMTAFGNIGAMQVMSLFGKTVRFPYLLYIVVRYLLLLLPVLAYGALALMLSAVTRKSAAAIAVTLILKYGSSIVMSILLLISSQTTVPGIKFLLFANTSLESYLPSATSALTAAASGYSTLVDNTMTLAFSIGILLVYLGCFLWIARDSFCRRDVK